MQQREDTLIAKVIHDKAEGKSFSEIGRETLQSKDSLQKRAKRAQLLNLPQPPELPPELHLQGDILFLSDLHMNSVLKSLVVKARRAARRFGLKTCVIGGDLFNFDVFSLYPTITAVAAMKDEIKGARMVLEYLLEVVETIYFFRGNHDDRVIKATCGQIDMEMICDLILPGENRSKLVGNLHNRAWLKANSGLWLLSHQKEYSKMPLVVADRLAQKYHCNVVTAHQHHFGMGVDQFGRYVIVDNPTMADPTKVGYKQLDTNTMPEWANGFSVIKDGAYLPYVEGKPIGFKFKGD